MRFLALGVLLALMAFFAAGEFALIRLRPSRVHQLLEDGEPGARAVARLQQRLRRVLVATQLGAVLALLAVGWIGRGIAAELGRTLAGAPGASLQAWVDVGVFLTLALLATVIGGLLPKAWVLHRPEPSALQMAPLLESLTRTLAPLLLLIERLSGGLLRLLGLPRNWDELVPVLSAGELETLIESGGVTGLLPDERSILEGVFSLRDTLVREVMVPRSGMVTLPLEVTFAGMMEAVHASQHARFPVIGTSLDDVRGLLDLRRLAGPIPRGQLQSDTPLAPYLVEVARVQESASLADRLVRQRAMASHPLDDDGEHVTGCGDGARLHHHLPLCLSRQIMQGKDAVAGKAGEQPILDHPHRAALVFLRRLEDQTHRAIEIACLGKVAGKAQQHGCMPVMAAGMHLAGIFRSIGKIGLLRDRQRIHVGAQADGPARGAIAEAGDDTGLGDPRRHLEAEAGAFLRHDAGGAFLLEQHLGMRMEVMPDGGEIGEMLLEEVLDHRFCGTFFSM